MADFTGREYKWRVRVCIRIVTHLSELILVLDDARARFPILRKVESEVGLARDWSRGDGWNRWQWEIQFGAINIGRGRLKTSGRARVGKTGTAIPSFVIFEPVVRIGAKARCGRGTAASQRDGTLLSLAHHQEDKGDYKGNDEHGDDYADNYRDLGAAEIT